MADNILPGSRTRGWSVTGPSPELIVDETKEAYRQDLYKKAAERAPDSNKIMDEILKKKYAPADKVVMAESAKGLLDEFNSRFSKDPFFVFTKEGRSVLGRLGHIVNSPLEGPATQAFEKSEKEYERLKNEKVLGLLSYRDYHVAVRDKDSGAEGMIRVDLYDPQRHIPLVIGEKYNSRIQNRGFLSDPTPEYEDIVNPNYVVSRIKDFLSSAKVSTDMTNPLYSAVAKITSGNKQALAEGAKALMSGVGLTSTEINTLQGLAASTLMGKGERPNKENIDKMVNDFVGHIVNSHLQSETRYAKGFGGGEDGGGEGKGKMGEISAVERYMSIPGYKNKITAGGVEVSATALPKSALSQSYNYYKKDGESGSPNLPKMNLLDLKATSTIPHDRTLILSSDGSEMGVLQGSLLNQEGRFVATGGRFDIVDMPYTSDNGVPQYISPFSKEAPLAFSRAKEAGLPKQYGMLIEVEMLGEGAFDTAPPDQNQAYVINELKKLKIASKEAGDDKFNTIENNTHDSLEGQNSLFLDRGYTKTYKFNVIVPVRSITDFRAIDGLFKLPSDVASKQPEKFLDITRKENYEYDGQTTLPGLEILDGNN